MITAKLKGQAALSAKLLAMQMETVRILSNALTEAAKPFVDYAVGAAPVASGGLARSVFARRMGHEDGAKATVRIGPAWAVYDRAGVVEYGKFHEYGSSQMAAEPFMRPAFDAGAPEALRIFSDEIKKALT